jgi:predicted kinase
MRDNGVLVLAGPPCSGKSEVGNALACDSRLYISVDRLFDLLLPGSDRNSADRMLAYDAAHLLARMLLERGLTPVLECTYSRLEQRTSLVEAIADVPSAPFWVVEFAVDPDEAVRRYRESPSHQATDLNEQLVRDRAQTFPYSVQALCLNSGSAPPGDLAHQIRRWLEHEPTPIERGQWALAGKSAGVP